MRMFTPADERPQALIRVITPPSSKTRRCLYFQLKSGFEDCNSMLCFMFARAYECLHAPDASM